GPGEGDDFGGVHRGVSSGEAEEGLEPGGPCALDRAREARAVPVRDGKGERIAGPPQPQRLGARAGGDLEQELPRDGGVEGGAAGDRVARDEEALAPLHTRSRTGVTPNAKRRMTRPPRARARSEPSRRGTARSARRARGPRRSRIFGGKAWRRWIVRTSVSRT